MLIKQLSACREQIPILVRWFHDEWGHLERSGSLEDIEKRLRANVETEPFPATLVGFLQDQPVATASLKLREMSTHLHLEHWIGTIYVPPDYRRRGFASEVVTAAVDHARDLGINTLHLFTIDQDRLYRGLGWTEIDRTQYHGDSVLIMRRDITSRQ